MRVVCHHTIDSLSRTFSNDPETALRRLAEAWNCLSQGIPFRTWEWLTAWWSAYGQGQELYLLTVHDDAGTLVGGAPWFLAKSSLAGRTIECLGTGDACGDYLGILATSEHEDHVISAISEWLVAANGSDSDPANRWDLLHLTGVSAADCAVAKLVEYLVEAGSAVHRRPATNCWRIALPDTWDSYEALLSKSHRKQVRRLDRRSLQTGQAVLRTARSEAELDAGLEILMHLHHKRRQMLHESGCFVRDEFRQYLTAAARSMFPLKRVALHWLEIEGQPAAAEIHWIGNGVVYAYQAGIEPDLMELEPGRLITIATLQKAMADGMSAFDFLRGDEPYKAHFRAEPQAQLELRLVAPKGMAQIRHGVWLAGDSLKGLLKTSLNLSGMR